MMCSTDRDALLALFRGAAGAKWYWYRNDNWGTDAELSQWYGVEVNNQGRVVELSLNEKYLQGMLYRRLFSIFLLSCDVVDVPQQFAHHQFCCFDCCRDVRAVYFRLSLSLNYFTLVKADRCLHFAPTSLLLATCRLHRFPSMSCASSLRLTLGVACLV